MIAAAALLLVVAPKTVETPHVMARFATELARDEWKRNSNVRLAASKIDGVVLKPGETFSFNKQVGSRLAKDGYLDAPMFTPDGKMDAVAGGLCQLSSTIYNAALLANLTIVERHPHSLTVRYLIPGRDATISSDSDLKFANSLGFPVRVNVSVRGRQLECVVWGARPRTAEVRISVSTRVLPGGEVCARTEKTVLKKGTEVTTVLSEDVYLPSHP